MATKYVCNINITNNYILIQLTAKEPDVNREDQGYINEFSRLYTKNKLLDKELKEIKVNKILLYNFYL